MSKSRSKTRWNLIVILIVAFALTYSAYKYFFRPTPAPIFLINPVSLDYGQTTVSGVLQKDAPAGQKGTFLLVLSDSRPVLLDVQGIDNLLGLKVSVSGILSPAPDSASPMSMTVQKITVTQ